VSGIPAAHQQLPFTVRCEWGRTGFSPEARLAADAFAAAEPRLGETLRECSSGRDLIVAGHAADVDIAAEVHASRSVALLTDGAFRRVQAPPADC
jgi:2-phosphosulfolactate phosphatase